MPYGRFFANEWLNERLFTNALGLQLLWIFEGAAGGHQPYDAKQQSIGGSVTAGAGFSASVSYSNSKAKGDFASVTESALQNPGGAHKHWVCADSSGYAIPRESSNQNLIPGSFYYAPVP